MKKLLIFAAVLIGVGVLVKVKRKTKTARCSRIVEVLLKGKSSNRAAHIANHMELSFLQISGASYYACEVQKSASCKGRYKELRSGFAKFRCVANSMAGKCKKGNLNACGIAGGLKKQMGDYKEVTAMIDLAMAGYESSLKNLFGLTYKPVTTTREQKLEEIRLRTIQNINEFDYGEEGPMATKENVGRAQERVEGIGRAIKNLVRIRNDCSKAGNPRCRKVVKSDFASFGRVHSTLKLICQKEEIFSCAMLGTTFAVQKQFEQALLANEQAIEFIDKAIRSGKRGAWKGYSTHNLRNLRRKLARDDKTLRRRQIPKG